MLNYADLEELVVIKLSGNRGFLLNLALSSNKLARRVR
jgi:hypothetical protein